MMSKNKKELTITEKRAKNRRTCLFYKILSFDLFFFYAISYLFLTNVKGFTTAQIVFTDSFYPLTKMICLIPFTIVVEKIGKKKSLVIASTCVFLFVLAIIFAQNLFILILSNILLGIAYTFKGLCDHTILYESLEDDDSKAEMFAKYESKSLSAFYSLDSVTSLATGFLYVVSPYLPLIISAAIEVIVVILTLNLYDIPDESKEKEEVKSFGKQLKDMTKNLGQSFKFIFRSTRLHSLIIYNSLFASLMVVTSTLRRGLLADVNVSSEFFGIIFTVLGIVASVSSSKSFAIHQKYRNRTLTFLGVSFCLSIIVSGLVLIINIPLWAMYYILLLMFSIQYILKGPFYTLTKQYLNSFCDNDLRLKIYSANSLIEYIVCTLLSFVSSFILTYCTNAETTIIIGSAALFIFIGLLIYMLDKVGLKPEQYKQENIDFYYTKK